MEYPPVKKHASMYHKSIEDLKTRQTKNSQNFSNYLKTAKDPKLIHQLSLQLIHNLSNSDEMSQVDRSKLIQLQSQILQSAALNVSEKDQIDALQEQMSTLAAQKGHHSKSILPTFSSESKTALLGNSDRAGETRYRSQMNLNPFSKATKSPSNPKAQSQVLRGGRGALKSDFALSPLRPMLKNATSVKPSQGGLSDSERPIFAYKDLDQSLLKISSKSEPKSSVMTESHLANGEAQPKDSNLNYLIYSNQNLSQNEIEPGVDRFSKIKGDPNRESIPFSELNFDNNEILSRYNTVGHSQFRDPRTSNTLALNAGFGKPPNVFTKHDRASAAQLMSTKTEVVTQNVSGAHSESLEKSLFRHKTHKSRTNRHFQSNPVNEASSREISKKSRNSLSRQQFSGSKKLSNPNSTLTENEIKINVIRALTNTPNLSQLTSHNFDSRGGSFRSIQEAGNDPTSQPFFRFGTQASALKNSRQPILSGKSLAVNFGKNQKKITEEFEEASEPASDRKANGRMREQRQRARKPLPRTTPHSTNQFRNSSSKLPFDPKHFSSTAPIRNGTQFSRRSLEGHFARGSYASRNAIKTNMDAEAASLLQNDISISPVASHDNSFRKKTAANMEQLTQRQQCLAKGLLGLQLVILSRKQKHLVSGFYRILSNRGKLTPKRGPSFAKAHPLSPSGWGVSNLYQLDWAERLRGDTTHRSGSQFKSVDTQIGADPPSSHRNSLLSRSMLIRKQAMNSSRRLKIELFLRHRQEGLLMKCLGAWRRRWLRRASKAEMANQFRLKRKGLELLRSLVLKKELNKIARQFHRFSLKKRLFAKLKGICHFHMENSFFVR